MNLYNAAERPAPSAVTLPSLLERKHQSDAIVAITAYDYPTARIAEQAGVDVVLVGDSLGMAVLGYPDTLSVTLDEMLHHAKAVRRALQRALLVVDMPFGTYHVSREETLKNAVRVMKEAGAACVKIEGGLQQADQVRALVQAEIPVMGHIGLTPQSLHRLGGYRVQGKSVPAAEMLLESALALEEAGASALVMECIPRELARTITQALTIPTIGIGAGPDCDGQILVMHDMLGFNERPPRFVRGFADVAATMRSGIEAYVAAVRGGGFPSDAESYHASGLRESSAAEKVVA